jgi:hypothetical protein
MDDDGTSRSALTSGTLRVTGCASRGTIRLQRARPGTKGLAFWPSRHDGDFVRSDKCCIETLLKASVKDATSL